MATISHIRGILLEEALLYLLGASGYSTVTEVGTDPTLAKGPAGLQVLGRGSRHQIDAIADFCLTPPFSYPQRLLVEAKCFRADHPVELNLVRNAVGVMKDVCEYWTPDATQATQKSRYHYQYAMFSASGYSVEAQRYAFAHDIYLIPLERSQFLTSVISSIRNVRHDDFDAPSWDSITIDLPTFRNEIRARLINNLDARPSSAGFQDILQINEFIRQCQNIGQAYLAMLMGVFPVFLVPSSQFGHGGPMQSIFGSGEIGQSRNIRIFFTESSWFIRDAASGQSLFSFDLPDELFNLYAQNGILQRTEALTMKAETMGQIQVVARIDAQPQFFTLNLDRGWLRTLRQRFDS
jgi:hypothetical protein